MLRIGNDGDPDPSAGVGGAFAELIRIQTEFQTRLADETLRYLRRLQGTVGPSVPGTVVLADKALRLAGSGSPGGSVELRLEVENRQRVHSVVTPALSPLVDDAGATWFPIAEASPPSALLPPGAAATLVVSVAIPGELPPGIYRGALLLPAFVSGGIPVAIEIATPKPNPATRRRRQRS
jgi:hypothetical protein